MKTSTIFLTAVMGLFLIGCVERASYSGQAIQAPPSVPSTVSGEEAEVAQSLDELSELDVLEQEDISFAEMEDLQLE